MNFTQIIQKALRTTFYNPVVWALGLFLSGGFNTHWFVFVKQLRFALENPHSFLLAILDNPIDVVMIVLLLVVTVIIGLVVSNWAKILLILHAAGILKLRRVRPGSRPAAAGPADLVEPVDQSAFGFQKKLAVESRRYVWPVIQVSLLTGALSIIGTIILFYPSAYLLRNNYNQELVLVLAILLFIAMLLALSFLNIFSCFFIILYQRRLKSGLRLATDLLQAKWQTITAFIVILMIVYCFGVLVSSGMVFLCQESIRGGFEILSHINNSLASAITGLEWALVGLVMIVWISFLNAFFNVALLIFFTELVKAQPAESVGEVESLKAPIPLH